MRDGQAELTGDVEELRMRIEAWRSSKTSKVERMPEALWLEAVEWARQIGVSRISQFLGIGYMGLRQRLGNAGESVVGTEIQGGDFVELGSWAGGSPLKLEVQKGDGSLLRVEGFAGSVRDAALLLRTFLGNL